METETDIAVRELVFEVDILKRKLEKILKILEKKNGKND